MNIVARRVLALTAMLVAAGCDDGPPPNTGGTTLPPGACGRGLVVVNSNAQSTNVSLVGLDGEVLSSSFFSSGSPTLDPQSQAPALSGDVVQPTMPQQGDRLVLIDRHFGVLSWVEVKTGKLQSLLPIGEEIALNLQDYIEVSPHKAYVPNLDPHLDPSLGAVEKGSNVVIVDPSAPAITGVVDLAPAMASEDPRFYPRPTRGVLVGKRLYLLLAPFDQFFKEAVVSRVVTIDTDTDTILSTTRLTGLYNCTGLGLSPSGKRLAVTCSGTFHVNDAGQRIADLSEAGVVLLTRSDDGLAEERRWSAEALGEGPLGFSASFASEDRLMFTTFGELGDDGKPVRDDTLLSLDITSGEHEVRIRPANAFVLWETRCMPACGLCFATEVGEGGKALHRFEVKDGVFSADQSITVDAEIGLPPRYLGQF
ncbi:MAG: hypothetical protein ABI193_09480 [Minicystis sp.]